MEENLTREEEEYLRELLSHHNRTIRGLKISANLFLVFGGLLLIVTAFYLIGNRTDNTVFFTGIPNFVGGIFLIGAYLLLSKRTRWTGGLERNERNRNQLGAWWYERDDLKGCERFSRQPLLGTVEQKNQSDTESANQRLHTYLL
jgi:hypothetical protein